MILLDMKFAFVVLAFCLVAAASRIIVTGRAEGHVPKTEVDLEFLVTFEDKSAGKALEGAQKQSDKLVKALKKFAGEDGVTASENNIEAITADDGSVVGYKASIEVELDLKEQKDLSKAIEEGSKLAKLQDVEYELDEVNKALCSPPKRTSRSSLWLRPIRMLKRRPKPTQRPLVPILESWIPLRSRI